MSISDDAGALSPNEFSLISEKQKRSPLCETPFGIFFEIVKMLNENIILACEKCISRFL
jgi:hypothetical protein